MTAISELLSAADRSVVVYFSLRGQLRFPDHLPICIRSLHGSSARVVYRRRCVLLAARSAKKVRRLSENSGNPL